MKKIMAILLAALCLLAAVAGAEEAQIRFEGLAWGVNPAEIDAALPDFPFSWAEYMMPYADSEIFPVTVDKRAAYTDHQLNGGLMGIAQQAVTICDETAYVTAYCAYPVADGAVVADAAEAGLYLVQCTFAVPDGDLDAAYHNLLERLTAQYGEGETYFDGDPRGENPLESEPVLVRAMAWRDEQGALMVLSLVNFSEDYQFLSRLALTYAVQDSDVMLDALAEALIAGDQK